VTLELYASIKGRPRRTGELSILLDASVMTRSASVNGTHPSVVRCLWYVALMTNIGSSACARYKQVLFDGGSTVPFIIGHLHFPGNSQRSVLF